MPRRSIAMRLRSELVDEVDVARGDVSRTRWVERALEAALDDARGPSSITPEVWESKALASQMYPDAPSKPKAAPSLPAGVSKGTAEVKAPYRCPDPKCSLRTLSPAATCPRHAKKVVPNE